MKRFFKFSSILIIILMFFLCFLLFSETGLKLTAKKIEKLSKSSIKIETIHGSLIKKISCSSLSYKDKNISITFNNLNFSWNPLSLLRGKFYLNNLFINAAKITILSNNKNKKKQTNFFLPDITLPLRIVLKRIEIKNIEIEEQSGSITKIDRGLLEMSLDKENVKIKFLQIKSINCDLNLTGSLYMKKNWSTKIKGDLRVRLPSSKNIKGLFYLDGFVQKGILKLFFLSPFKTKVITEYNLQEGIHLQSKIISKNINPDIYYKKFPGKLNGEAFIDFLFKEEKITATIDLKNIDGNIRNIPVKLHSRIQLIDNELNFEDLLLETHSSFFSLNGKISDKLDLKFTFNSPSIESLTKELIGKIEGKGRIIGSKNLPIIDANFKGSDIEAKGIKINSLLGNITGSLGLKGNLTANFIAQNISKEENQIEHLDFIFSGGLDKNRMQVNIQNQNNKITLEADGKITNGNWKGEIKDLNFSSNGDKKIFQEKPAFLEIASRKIILENLCVFQKEGKMFLDGSFDEGKWKASIKLFNFSTDYFYKNWPSKINCEINGWGDTSNNTELNHIELNYLSGTIKDKNLNGGGYINFQNKTMLFNDFFISIDDANIAVKGFINDSLNLSFNLTIPSLQEFTPNCNGDISMSGSFLGNRKAPFLKLDFDTKLIKTTNFSLDEMNGNIALNLKDNGPILSNIHISNMTNKLLIVTTGDIKINGTTKNHYAELVMETNEGNIFLKLKGTYEDYWSGIINDFTIISNKFGKCNNDGETQINFEKEEKKLTNLCMKSDKVNISLNAMIDNEKKWSIFGEINSLNLSLLNDFKLFSPPIKGILHCTFNAKGQNKLISFLDAKSSISDILVSSTLGDENDFSYSFKENSANIFLNENELTLSLKSNFQENSDLNAIFRIKGINDVNANYTLLPIDGETHFTINDLSLISILSKSLIKPTGNICGNIKINGTMDQPIIGGNLKLQEGSVNIPKLGINVKDINLKIDDSLKNTINFEYSGKSDKGEIIGKGMFLYYSSLKWHLKTDINGSNFDVLNTEEYKIRVNPDIHIELKNNYCKLWGKLYIPYARITSVENNDSISPSEDVIIIDEIIENKKQKRILETNISIILGNDIQIDAFGLKSYLTGNLEIKDVPDKLPTAIGELDVKNGEFSLYSTKLKIDRGKLLFTGRQFDNPGVDFRGQRKVGTRIVGVDIGGTVKDLEFFLFSDPTMDESEILAYLLVGKSIYTSSEEQQSLIGAAANVLGLEGANKFFGKIGEYIPVDDIYLDGGTTSKDMSLVVEKKITDDLFIGYDHNFFDSTSDFRIQYKLGHGFSVETKSSLNATSGDILYSIER